MLGAAYLRLRRNEGSHIKKRETPSAHITNNAIQTKIQRVQPLGVFFVHRVPVYGVRFIVPFALELFAVAVTTTEVLKPTFDVLTVNRADLLPALTASDAGTVTALFPLASVTTIPPAGAGASSVTVPFVPVPP